MTIWLIIISAVIALDQATKWLVISFLDKDTPLVIIKGVLRLSYVENMGAAFGSFDEHRWVFLIVSTLGIIGMLVYLLFFRPKSKWACTALSMIIGGGIGNMIDRTFYKGTLPHTAGKNVVIDFIDFCAFPDIWPWVFIVADSFVCVGAGILMAWCIFSFIAECKADKAKTVGQSALDENESGKEDTVEKQ